jgi:phage gp36-like protein
MPYLSPADYVEIFGQPETIRITDTDKTGAVDDVKVANAIADAGLFADAYLSSRYTLPFSVVPELLAKAVADLAREALHTNRPTEAVTLNADRARTLLRDLQAGRASVPAPIAGGDAPATNPDSLPVAANDRRARVFTESALADFNDLGSGRGCYPGPRWA